MKIVFDIEAVENIVSKLRTNYENQTKQKSLVGGEAQAISTAWEGQSATAFSNKVSGVMGERKEDLEYDTCVSFLEVIKNSYSQGKDEVSKLSANLKASQYNVYNSTIGKPLDADLSKADELKQYLMAIVDTFEFFKGVNRQSIDIIRSAWKDGDEINLLETLEICDRFYNDVVTCVRDMATTANRNGGGG